LRFADAPDVRYRALTLSDDKDQLRSYLIYHFHGNTAHVADFLYEKPADLAALLPRTAGACAPLGMESAVVESLVPDSIADLLKRFGFWRRPSNWPLLVYVPKPTEQQWQEEGLVELGNWYFTRADVDTMFELVLRTRRGSVCRRGR